MSDPEANKTAGTDNNIETGGATVHPAMAAIGKMLGAKPASAPPRPTSGPAAGSVTGSAGAGGDKKEKPAMPPGALVSVVTRNEFYRDGFRNLIKIAILEAVVILGLIMALIVHINSVQPQDRYFATTADGRIMQLLPLNLPNMTTAALMSWVAQAATETMTFGYHDYQRRLQQSSRHFTKRGWETFSTALQKSRILDSVQELQQVVTAVPSSAPILVQQGIFGGKYRWIVRLPLQVTYQGKGGNRVDKLDVQLVIDRVPSLENPNGVGIEQWVATAQP